MLEEPCLYRFEPPALLRGFAFMYLDVVLELDVSLLLL